MNPAMTKKELDDIENNIDTIYEELIRQLNSQDRSTDRINRILEFIMGFVGIIVTYLITQKDFFVFDFENTILINNHYYATIMPISFYFGLLLIVISGIIAFLAYGTKKFDVGPEVKDFLKENVGKATYNFKLELISHLCFSRDNNENIVESKVKLTKRSYLALGLGVFLILITKSIYYLIST